jgi:hypothetical protein
MLFAGFAVVSTGNLREIWPAAFREGVRLRAECPLGAGLMGPDLPP